MKKLVANAYNEVADAVSKGGDEMADKVMQAVQKVHPTFSNSTHFL